MCERTMPVRPIGSLIAGRVRTYLSLSHYPTCHTGSCLVTNASPTPWTRAGREGSEVDLATKRLALAMDRHLNPLSRSRRYFHNSLLDNHSGRIPRRELDDHMADGARVGRALSDILRTRVSSSVGLARPSRPRVESGPARAEGEVRDSRRT